MGVFAPLCIIQGGKSLYAFAKTRAYHDNTTTMVYMLVKSNENPTHTLENLTWTPVSVISTVGYTEVNTSGPLLRYNCAFDVDTGEFTLFHVALDAQYTSSPAGMQYVPPGASGGNAKPPTDAYVGTGTWRNVTFPPNYQWPKAGPSRLFYYKDTQSKSHLMHVYNNLTDVRVATLDPVTMTMNQGPSWTSTIKGYFAPKTFNANSQNIYMLAENYTAMNTATLYQFPINSANPTSPPQPTLLEFNGTQTQCYGMANFYYLFTFRNNPLMVCERYPPSSIAILNGVELTMLPGITGGIDQSSVSAIDIVDVPSAVPYLIYQDTKRGVFSVPLSGQFAGIKISAKKNMTVAEDYGDYPPPSFDGSDGAIPGWGSGLGKGGSKSSTGAIVGGVCAVVVVVVAALGVLYHRRRRRQWNNQGIDRAKPNSPDSSLPTTTAAAGRHSTQSWNQEPVQQDQPPLQYLEVNDEEQGQQHNYGHSNNGFATQHPVTSSGPLPGYSRYPPPVPVHSRPLTPQHGFP